MELGQTTAGEPVVDGTVGPPAQGRTESPGAAATMVERMIGAARLDAATYAAIANDRTATVQAGLVIVLSVVASIIASIGDIDVAVLVAMLVVGPILWVIFSASTYAIGLRLQTGSTTTGDLGAVLRVVGFAATPSLLVVLAVIPWLEWPIGAIVLVWEFLAVAVGLRQALALNTSRAIVTTVLGAIVGVVVWVIAVVVVSVTAGALFD